MPSPEKHLQTVAVPFGWEDGQLMIGLVTAHRSRNWTLPKISIREGADAAEIASNEALRQGGYLGLVDPEPLLTLVSAKGVEVSYFAVELYGILDSWDSNRTQSRKLVPLVRIEKHLHDRLAMRAIRILTEERIGARRGKEARRRDDRTIER